MRRTYAVVVIAVACLSLVVVMLANVAYTRHVQQQADKRWCDLLTTVDRPGPIPTTGDPQRDAANRKAQQQLHKLRIDLGCEKGHRR